MDNNETPCINCVGSGDDPVFGDTDCSYCGGTGIDLTETVAEAERDIATGNTVSWKALFD